MDDEDKPREKIVKYGPDRLSAPELLAIILNTGTRKEEVFNMTSRVIKEYGEKNIANQNNPKILSRELDIPLVKACQIVACFELGKRFFKEAPGRQVIIKLARHAYNYLREMQNLPKEQLRGLYLNSRYKLIHDEVISVGTLTANIIHPREVFAPAISCSAVAVIVAHNHPSGSIKPSKADIEITKRLKEASKILGIEFLDHIIIAGNRFASIPLNDG